ncbi:MAG: HNH endonuclease [Flavobacteriales bacterium]|nr:HNH endonuclease [Flavobacteriales bacterium]
MASAYLKKLSAADRSELVQRLWDIQQGKCFISQKPIDLVLHKDSLDIDHIVPSKLGGRDDPSNFALTFLSANRSKQASDLKLARILEGFKKIQEETKKEDRNPNLNDLLQRVGGAKHQLVFTRDGDHIKFSFAETGDSEIAQVRVYKDQLSGDEYFFSTFPLAYLHHDDVINPRSIGGNLPKLVAEFYSSNPQLHISLGWIDLEEGNRTNVKIFDGQHKAAAQILLGVKEIPVRVFINPDKNKLIDTNFKAGTTLRQVAFDKSVQRHLGNTMYKERVEQYQLETKREVDDYNFSEKDLISFFKGESREMKRYILDSVRDSITHSKENKLKEYIDFGGRGKEKPLSYSTVEKTFFSFFIYSDALQTNLDYKLEEGLNPRELEKEQIRHLMNIIADEILIGKFDFDIGTNRIENQIQKGESLPMEHVRAYRMVKEEVLYNWLKYIQQIVTSYFIMQGKPLDQSKLFQNEFPDILWSQIRRFIRELTALPLWVNNQLSATVFGGKQNYSFWHEIFLKGESSQGVKVLAKPLNIMEMINGAGIE